MGPFLIRSLAGRAGSGRCKRDGDVRCDAGRDAPAVTCSPCWRPCGVTCWTPTAVPGQTAPRPLSGRQSSRAGRVIPDDERTGTGQDGDGQDGLVTAPDGPPPIGASSHVTRIITRMWPAASKKAGWPHSPTVQRYLWRH